MILSQIDQSTLPTMMSFNDFVYEYNLKIKATSKFKYLQILPFLSLMSDVGIFLGGGLFSIDVSIVNSHPTKRTDWVAYLNENY